MVKITNKEYQKVKLLASSVPTISTAIVQGALRWGYSKASVALEILEKEEIIGPVRVDQHGCFQDVLSYTPIIQPKPIKK